MVQFWCLCVCHRCLRQWTTQTYTARWCMCVLTTSCHSQHWDFQKIGLSHLLCLMKSHGPAAVPRASQWAFGAHDATHIQFKGVVCLDLMCIIRMINKHTRQPLYEVHHSKVLAGPLFAFRNALSLHGTNFWQDYGNIPWRFSSILLWWLHTVVSCIIMMQIPCFIPPQPKGALLVTVEVMWTEWIQSHIQDISFRWSKPYDIVYRGSSDEDE